MAAKAKSKAEPRENRKLPVSWDEKMAEEAEIAKAMEEGAATGQFFSTKGGVLQWNDSPLPDNQMAVIILDSILENVFYDEDYDPDAPAGPSCFAFGRKEKDLEPHIIVKEAQTQQNDVCGIAGQEGCCPQNEWASADKGRGKACRNTRRLAMIPAGSFGRNGGFELNETLNSYEAAGIGYMKLPVTSVKGYAAFVKSASEVLKRPPWGLVTRVRVVPDTKSVFKVVFEPLMKLPDELMQIVMHRHEEAAALIDFPYQPFEEQEQERKPSKAEKLAQRRSGPAGKAGSARGRKY